MAYTFSTTLFNEVVLLDNLLLCGINQNFASIQAFTMGSIQQFCGYKLWRLREISVIFLYSKSISLEWPQKFDLRVYINFRERKKPFKLWRIIPTKGYTLKFYKQYHSKLGMKIVELISFFQKPGKPGRNEIFIYSLIWRKMMKFN